MQVEKSLRRKYPPHGPERASFGRSFHDDMHRWTYWFMALQHSGTISHAKLGVFTIKTF